MKYHLFTDASCDTTMGTGACAIAYRIECGELVLQEALPCNKSDANQAEKFAMIKALRVLSRMATVDDDVLMTIDSDACDRDLQAGLLEQLRNVYVGKSFKSIEYRVIKSHRNHSPVHLANQQVDRAAKTLMRSLRDNILSKQEKDRGHHSETI